MAAVGVVVATTEEAERAAIATKTRVEATIKVEDKSPLVQKTHKEATAIMVLETTRRKSAATATIVEIKVEVARGVMLLRASDPSFLPRKQKKYLEDSGWPAIFASRSQ